MVERVKCYKAGAEVRAKESVDGPQLCFLSQPLLPGCIFPQRRTRREPGS